MGRFEFILGTLLAATLLVGPTAMMAPFGLTPRRDPAVTDPGPIALRLAYLPNLTHAPALVALQRGLLTARLAGRARLEARAFAAGPAAIEALLAGEIDVAYVGPNPAVNGYIRSRGEALRVVAGAASGGVQFVVRPEARIVGPADLAGKTIAVPQRGGTQDVALRHYLRQHGLAAADDGGTVTVMPTAGPEIVALFRGGRVHGAWVPEPWATHLVVEAGGYVFLDERALWASGDFSTTVVVASARLLDQQPHLVSAVLEAHLDALAAIAADPAAAGQAIDTEVVRLTGKPTPAGVLGRALRNVRFTYDPLEASVRRQADAAFDVGLLGRVAPDLSGLVSLAPLNAVLRIHALPEVSPVSFTETTATLRVVGVSKRFTARDSPLEALASVDLDVAAGEFVCLLGESGCGKSTLLSLVAGLEAPTAGVITVHGAPITGPSPDRVLLFQDAGLFPWLSVEENVAFGLRQQRLPRGARREIVDEWLARIQLQEFRAAFVHELSGGMRQRVALARALAVRPSMVLMDEPFGALDALTRAHLHRELESLWERSGTTIVFVTHDVREAVALGDRVVVMSPRPGRIVHDIRVDLERPRSPEHPRVAALAAEIAGALRSGQRGRAEARPVGEPAWLQASAT